MAEYVIIGNGTAAVGCIEGIRSVDKKSSITVVSEEKYPAYCRPLISYYLEKKTTIEKMQQYRPCDFYTDNNVKVIYGVKATKINTNDKTVSLSDGSSLSYTSICIATGSTPFVPPFEGLETVESKCSFMTIDDTLKLESLISEESRVMIMGAGLIGMKCAEGICERVKSVVVADLAPSVLSSILDPIPAAMMQKALEDKGVSFILSDTAQKFTKNCAEMKSGKKVEFDVLVLAIGVRANIGLVKDIGGETNRGIVVNEKMETSLEGIYAAGDCSEGFDYSFGSKRVLAILPNAYIQGNTAGKNMAGEETKFENSIPMNSIGFFGVHAMTAGSKLDDGEVYEEISENKIKRLFTKDGYLTGFMLVNDCERAGIYTSLIREHVSLDEVSFELLKKNPTLAAFSTSARDKKLGGVV